MEKFESQIRSISAEICSTIQFHISGLERRQDQLLQQVETIKKIYGTLLQYQISQQKPVIRNGSSGSSIMSPDGHIMSSSSSPFSNNDWDMMINGSNGIMLPNVSFTKPDHALYKAISSLGFLTSPAFAPYCSVNGDGLDRVVPGQNVSFVITTRNCFQEEILLGRENIHVRILAVFPGLNGTNGSPVGQNGSSGEHLMSPGSLLSSYGSMMMKIPPGLSPSFTPLDPHNSNPSAAGAASMFSLTGPSGGSSGSPNLNQSSAAASHSPSPVSASSLNQTSQLLVPSASKVPSAPAATSCVPNSGSSNSNSILGPAPVNSSNNSTLLMVPNSSSAASSPLGLVKSIITHSIVDHNNGKYTVTYMIPVSQSRPAPGHLEMVVNVNGVPIHGSPFKINVQRQQRSNWRRLMAFGVEGNMIGQFCRPWGIAVARMPPDFGVTSFNNSSKMSSSESPLVDHLTPHQYTDPYDHPHHSSPLLSPGLMGSTASGGNSPNGKLLSSNSSSSDVSIGLSSNPSNNSSTNNGLSPNSKGNNPPYIVAVADRSNNRVQVFKLDLDSRQMTSVYVFGSGPGTRNGQFDRPAGLCFNMSRGQIIVADKDNHRVQVFDLTGRFLFKFGEKGQRVGQFCYPWDVDSCPNNHQIAVSDTRNRRVQLFSPEGRFVCHFTQPLDSPRGVSFLTGNKILISDFNKHRLLIFDRSNPAGHNHNQNHDQQQLHPHHSQHYSGSGNGSSAPTTPTPPGGVLCPRFIGFGEGNGWGEFLRPQGTAISSNYVFCSDSRNNRVCLYNLMTQSFEYLNEDLNLDRPAGIAVIDNLMMVVDFGNNRIQICHR